MTGQEKGSPRLLLLSSKLGTLDQQSHYDLLGINQSAELRDVKHAFHSFALSFHPDRYNGASEEEAELARRIFARGVKAYDVLRNRERRADYDLNLARGVVGGARLDAASGATPRARSLVDLCQTPAARLPARQAEKLINDGALRDARRYLMEAISKDGGSNPELEARLDDLDLALHAMG